MKKEKSIFFFPKKSFFYFYFFKKIKSFFIFKSIVDNSIWKWPKTENIDELDDFIVFF